MARRIAVISQTGGVGKTTVSLNLALSLAERGRRVVLVDLDPQGGLGHALAKGDTELAGLADVLAGAATLDAALLRTKVPGLTLLPRGRLDPTDVCELELTLHTPGVLERILDSADAGADVTILDTPSGLGMPTRAALRVAEFALLPVQAERLALRSIAQALRVIEHVRGTENPRLELLGILPTMAEKHKGPSMSVLVDVWTELAGVLDTIVPRADVFAEASEAGLPVGFLAGPPAPEARRFDLLAEEIATTMARLSGGRGDTDDRPQRQLL